MHAARQPVVFNTDAHRKLIITKVIPIHRKKLVITEGLGKVTGHEPIPRLGRRRCLHSKLPSKQDSLIGTPTTSKFPRASFRHFNYHHRIPFPVAHRFELSMNPPASSSSHPPSFIDNLDENSSAQQQSAPSALAAVHLVDNAMRGVAYWWKSS